MTTPRTMNNWMKISSLMISTDFIVIVQHMYEGGHCLLFSFIRESISYSLSAIKSRSRHFEWPLKLSVVVKHDKLPIIQGMKSRCGLANY